MVPLPFTPRGHFYTHKLENHLSVPCASPNHTPSCVIPPMLADARKYEKTPRYFPQFYYLGIYTDVNED